MGVAYSNPSMNSFIFLIMHLSQRDDHDYFPATYTAHEKNKTRIPIDKTKNENGGPSVPKYKTVRYFCEKNEGGPLHQKIKL